MKNFLTWLEIGAGVLAVVANLALAFLDLTGFLSEIEWLQTRILSIILSSISLILIFLLVTSYKDRETIKNLSEYFMKDSIERTKLLRGHIDGNLQLVVGQYFDDIIIKLNSILINKSFEINDIEAFSSFYKNTLIHFYDAEFFATSIPSNRFFWSKQSVNNQMHKFLKNEGKMKRIFFLEDITDLDNQEVFTILKNQESYGVEVYITLRSKVPINLQRFFMVDSRLRIAWEPILGPGDSIKGIKLTANRDETSKYKDLFMELLNLDCTKRFYSSKTLKRPISQIIEGKGVTKNMQYPDNVKSFKNFEYDGWQKSVNAYNQYFGKLTSQVIPTLLDSVISDNTKKIIDIATGPGYVANAASERGILVYGIDFSEEMLELANKHSKGTFSLGDAENISFENNSFDAAVMNFGMLHLAQPEQATNEAFRVIKKGGKFSFTVWKTPEYSKGFDIVLRSIEKHGNTEVELPSGPAFFKYSDPSEAFKLLEDNGFSQTSLKEYNMVWEIDDSDALFYAFLNGTARTGGLLREQTKESLEKIRQEVQTLAREYRDTNNNYKIPMSCLVITGQKT